MKHKYRKHRTLITVVAKKTLNVGETLHPDNTLAVCFTTCSRDIYQEITTVRLNFRAVDLTH